MDLELYNNMLDATGNNLPEKQEFEVKDMLAADWALGKIRVHEMRQSQRKTFAEEQKRRIDEWLEKENAADESFVLWLTEKLHPWARQELQDEKKRSIALPSGKLGFRKIGGGIEITDETEALEWAKTNCPEAVKIKESVLKTPLKKHMETTGEIADGCEIVPESDKFYITTEPINDGK